MLESHCLPPPAGSHGECIADVVQQGHNSWQAVEDEQYYSLTPNWRWAELDRDEKKWKANSDLRSLLCCNGY